MANNNARKSKQLYYNYTRILLQLDITIFKILLGFSTPVSL